MHLLQIKNAPSADAGGRRLCPLTCMGAENERSIDAAGAKQRQNSSEYKCKTNVYTARILRVAISETVWCIMQRAEVFGAVCTEVNV